MRTQSLPTLYNKASTGKITIRITDVIEQPDGSVHIQVQHGYQGGKLQTDTRVITEGKNLGKANETTTWDQAVSEAVSACNRKRDEGYVEDPSLIKDKSAGNFLPMLAKDFAKDGKKIKYPCYVQPKLDGMRALARKENGVVTMWSRQGKPITIPSLIIQELTGWLEEGEAVDGELYVHGWDFQRLIAATKKDRDDTKLLEYHIYDRPAPGGFVTRMDPLYNRGSLGQIHLVPSWECNSFQEVEEHEKRFIQEGYEGLMLRNRDGDYGYDDRSYDLQKLKRFQDAEYRIVGGRQGDGRATGCVIYTCVTPDGKEFEVFPQGSIEHRRELYSRLQEDLGKLLTVKFFELTQDGIPRFPIGIAIRDYEE